MATVSSHLLDAVDGCSAAGTSVSLIQISTDGSRREVFSVETDSEGRISQPVQPGEPGDRYELIFDTATYFRSRQSRTDNQIGAVVDSVVVRFAMPDPQRRYHIPVIASPNGYSLWWSQ